MSRGLSAKTLTPLPAGAPSHLRYLVGELEACLAQEQWNEAVTRARDVLEFLRAYLAAAALKLWKKVPREAVLAPPAENRWPELLEKAAPHLPDTGLGADLRALVKQGLPRPVPVGAEPQQLLSELLPGLRAALERCAAFFGRWTESVEPGPEEGRLRVLLQGSGERLDLDPFFHLGDDPDTRTLGQPFILAGGTSTGGLAYRNLRLHNLVFRPAPDAAWSRRPEDRRLPPTGGGRPFHDDADKVPHEMVLAPLRRHLSDSASGYLVVEGPEGLGKTYVARFLHQDERSARGAQLLYFPLSEEERIDPSLFVLRLDERLREDDRHLLPHPEVARALLRRQANESLRLPEYLLTLARFDGRPAVLLLDGPDERHEELADLLPDQLPDKVFVAVFCDPNRLGDRLRARFEELGVRGMRLQLTGQDDATRDLVTRLGDARAASPLALRLGYGGSAPPAEGRLAELASELGTSEFARGPGKALLLLTAAGGPLPVAHLADRLGSWESLDVAAGRLGPLLVRDGAWMAAGHPSVLDHLRGGYPDEVSAAARRLASWAVDELGGDGSWARLAAERLFQWLGLARDRNLERRCLTDPALKTSLLSHLNTDPGGPLWGALEALRLWIAGLAPLAEREPELSAVQAELLLLRSRVCLAAGDEDGARTEVDRAVERLGSIVRWGQASPQVTVHLAEAFCHRALLQVERGGHRQAADDARRALELLARVNRQGGEVEAEARWVLGVAALWENEEDQSLPELTRSVEIAPTLRSRRWLAELESRLGHVGQALELLEDDAGEPRERALALLTRGRIREESEDTDAAQRDLQQAGALLGTLVDDEYRLDLRGLRAETDHEHALLLWGQSRPAEAERALTRAVDTYRTLVDEGDVRHTPELARALGDRGLVRAALADRAGLDDYAESVRLLMRLVEKERRLTLRAELARASNNRGMMLAGLGRLEESLKEFARAAEHYETLAVRQGHREHLPELGLACYNRAGALRRLARGEEAASEYDRAVEHLRAALEAGEESTDELAGALINRAFCLAELRRHEEAVRDDSEAVRLHEHPAAFNNRAETLALQGKLEEALADYRKAVELDGRVGYQLNEARALGCLGRFAEARERLESLVETAQGLELATTHSLMSWCSQALEERERAVTECRRAIRLFERLGEDKQPELGRVLRRRARLRQHLKEFAEAVADLDRAQDQFDDPRELFTVEAVRSELLRTWGKPQEAEQAAQRCLELANLPQERARAHHLLGHARHDLGNRDEAHREFTQAIGLFTELVEDHKRLDLTAELAESYGLRARTEKRREEALPDYGWAVDIYHELVERENRSELRTRLAEALVERAEVLKELEREDDEDRDLKRAVVLYHALVEEGQGAHAESLARCATRLSELRRRKGELTAARNLCQRATRALGAHPQEVPEALAAALRESAIVAEALRELPRALDHHNQAVEVLDELVRLHGQAQRSRELLDQRLHRADVLIRLGRLDEAHEDLEVAVDGLRGSGDHQALASALTQRASVLGRLGQLERALESYTEALQLVAGNEDDFLLRAEALSKRGLTFNHHGRYQEAVESFSQAVKELRTEPVSLQLGLVLLHRGEAQAGLGLTQKAYDDSDRAVELMSHLAASSSSLGLHSSLGQAYANRGRALVGMKKAARALQDFRAAVDIFTRLSEEHDYVSFRERLAETYFDRARAAEAAGDTVESLSAIRNSVVIYRAMAGRDDRHRETLAESLIFRARLLEKSGKKDQAAEDFQMAASILTVLVQAEGRTDLAERLRACSRR